MAFMFKFLLWIGWQGRARQHVSHRAVARPMTGAGAVSLRLSKIRKPQRSSAEERSLRTFYRNMQVCHEMMAVVPLLAEVISIHANVKHLSRKGFSHLSYLH